MKRVNPRIIGIDKGKEIKFNVIDQIFNKNIK